MLKMNEPDWKPETTDLDRLLDDGPHTGVEWRLPILPGVLLVDSYWALGPMCAASHVKVVMYYGFGTTELMQLYGKIT